MSGCGYRVIFPFGEDCDKDGALRSVEIAEPATESRARPQVPNSSKVAESDSAR